MVVVVVVCRGHDSRLRRGGHDLSSWLVLGFFMDTSWKMLVHLIEINTEMNRSVWMCHREIQHAHVFMVDSGGA